METQSVQTQIVNHFCFACDTRHHFQGANGPSPDTAGFKLSNLMARGGSVKINLKKYSFFILFYLMDN